MGGRYNLQRSVSSFVKRTTYPINKEHQLIQEYVLKLSGALLPQYKNSDIVSSPLKRFEAHWPNISVGRHTAPSLLSPEAFEMYLGMSASHSCGLGVIKGISDNQRLA